MEVPQKSVESWTMQEGFAFQYLLQRGKEGSVLKLSIAETDVQLIVLLPSQYYPLPFHIRDSTLLPWYFWMPREVYMHHPLLEHLEKTQGLWLWCPNTVVHGYWTPPLIVETTLFSVLSLSWGLTSKGQYMQAWAENLAYQIKVLATGELQEKLDLKASWNSTGQAPFCHKV